MTNEDKIIVIMIFLKKVFVARWMETKRMTFLTVQDMCPARRSSDQTDSPSHGGICTFRGD